MNDVAVEGFATQTAEYLVGVSAELGVDLHRIAIDSPRAPRADGSLRRAAEVFPQAIVRAIGAGQIHKFKPGGVDAQLRAVSVHTGWPENATEAAELADVCGAPRHDCLDAYLAAWVAALEEEARIAHGTPPDDAIWTSRVAPSEPVRQQNLVDVDVPGTIQPLPTPVLDQLCPALA